MSNEAELERAIVVAGSQIISTLEQIGRDIGLADESFTPHIAIAQETSDRTARIRAYQDAAGPISRYAAKLFALERALRDQVTDYASSFERRFQFPELGTGKLVPTLEAQLDAASTFRRQLLDQRDAAALVASHRAEPHLTAAFGDLADVLSKVIEDTDRVIAFVKRSLKRLR